MPCKCIYKLDFNVLTMVNKGLQRLIIDVLMINVTCTDSQESKWEKSLYKYTVSKYGSNWGYFKNT